MELDLLLEPPFEVCARFELAAARIADAWLAARGGRVSREDFGIARAFLERDGWKVEELPGVRVRLACHEVAPSVMTREAAVLVALRRLARPRFGRPSALVSSTPVRRVAFTVRSLAPLPRLDVSPPARSGEAAVPVELPA